MCSTNNCVFINLSGEIIQPLADGGKAVSMSTYNGTKTLHIRIYFGATDKKSYSLGDCDVKTRLPGLDKSEKYHTNAVWSTTQRPNAVRLLKMLLMFPKLKPGSPHYSDSGAADVTRPASVPQTFPDYTWGDDSFFNTCALLVAAVHDKYIPVMPLAKKRNTTLLQPLKMCQRKPMERLCMNYTF